MDENRAAWSVLSALAQLFALVVKINRKDRVMPPHSYCVLNASSMAGTQFWGRSCKNEYYSYTTMCTQALITGVVSRSAKTLLYTPGSTALPPVHVQGASSSWKPLRPEIGTIAKSMLKRRVEMKNKNFSEKKLEKVLA
jgi:hypothetical protein